MSLWTLTNPPVWKSDAVATSAGWADPDTGEVLVTIDGLSTFKTHAPLINVALDVTHAHRILQSDGSFLFSFLTGDVIPLVLTFGEEVQLSPYDITNNLSTVTVAIGSGSASFDYVSGQFSTKLVYHYTVLVGDTGAAGTVTPTAITHHIHTYIPGHPLNDETHYLVDTTLTGKIDPIFELVEVNPS